MSHERDYVSSASCARIPAELDPYTFDERCENGASSLQSFDNKKGSTHLLEGKPGKSISSSTQKRTKRKRIETDVATEQEEESSRLEHLSLTAKHEMTDESSHAALPIRRKRKANPGTSQTQDSVSSTKSSRHVDHDSVYEESTDLLSAAREEQLKTGFKLRKMRRKCCQEVPRTMAFGNEKVLAEEPIMLQQRNIDTLRVGCNNESVICIDAVEPETFDVDLEISPTKPHISVNQEVLSEQAISAIVAPSEISLENEDFPEHTVQLKNRNSSDRIVAEKRKLRNCSRQSKPKKRSRKTGKFLGNSTVKSAPETGMKPLPEDNDETPSNPGSPSTYNELLNTGFHENLQSDSSSQPTSDELFDRLLAEAKNCTKKTVTFADNLLILDDFDPLPPNPSKGLYLGIEIIQL
ncbi:Hypothetical protein NTJ_01218 [Nesidiocoris tenuis]|uniref:Uncharacterized protein n=1 Tax=Nesidiocoris tenuis TaxID=355587 RepID=A0ABN7AB19_9HEMI|nr:Hypothetical protein NTJ_01218 [Nesidiocoris tenuis]